MEKQAIRERAKRVRRIERLSTMEWPPNPKKVTAAVAELLALSEAPQDRLQRTSRERLLTACQAYASRNRCMNDYCAASVRNTWRLFEMMWRDDRGRMIAPDFLTRDWKDPAIAGVKSTAAAVSPPASLAHSRRGN
jgi:hypothetical protein